MFYSLPAGMNTNCQRFHESSLLQSHVLRQLVAKVCSMNVIPDKKYLTCF